MMGSHEKGAAGIEQATQVTLSLETSEPAFVAGNSSFVLAFRLSNPVRKYNDTPEDTYQRRLPGLLLSRYYAEPLTIRSVSL